MYSGHLVIAANKTWPVGGWIIEVPLYIIFAELCHNVVIWHWRVPSIWKLCQHGSATIVVSVKLLKSKLVKMLNNSEPRVETQVLVYSLRSGFRQREHVSPSVCRVSCSPARDNGIKVCLAGPTAGREGVLHHKNRLSIIYPLVQVFHNLGLQGPNLPSVSIHWWNQVDWSACLWSLWTVQRHPHHRFSSFHRILSQVSSLLRHLYR